MIKLNRVFGIYDKSAPINRSESTDRGIITIKYLLLGAVHA